MNPTPGKNIFQELQYLGAPAYPALFAIAFRPTLPGYGSDPDRLSLIKQLQLRKSKRENALCAEYLSILRTSEYSGMSFFL